MEEASLYSESLIYIIMFASVMMSALCSTLEATLLSTPLSFITGLEEQGVKGAARLKKLKQHPERPISAILCLNTIANTVGASIVGSLVYEVYGDAIVGIFSTIFTFMILIFAEIIPKTIGTSYWRSLALTASVIINGMIFIMFPLVWVLEKLTSIISSKSTQISISREDISAMVSVATEEEVIEKEEKKMIQNLLKLDEITAHEIMTPSAVVEMAESHMTIRDFYDSEDLTHSRIPVYDDENDEYVIGYVLRQEILEKMAEDKFTTTLDEITRPIMTFKEDDTVSDIWEKMLEKKEHISVILDEYGSVRGIVTMEDVIETMIGHEIVDETDEVVDMQEYAKEQWEKAQKELIKAE
jgi:CBS domain containing-hemolysin-like protein